jgi:hypothetical protein
LNVRLEGVSIFIASHIAAAVSVENLFDRPVKYTFTFVLGLLRAKSFAATNPTASLFPAPHTKAKLVLLGNLFWSKEASFMPALVIFFLSSMPKKRLFAAKIEAAISDNVLGMGMD